MSADTDGHRGSDRRSLLVPALTIGAGVLLVLLLIGIAAQLRGRGDDTAAVAPSPSPGAGPTRTTIVIGAPTGGTRTATATGTGAGPGPTTAPAPAQTPAAATQRFFTVSGTGGDGIRLRSAPAASGTQIAVYPEGERLEQIGPDREGDGRTWRSVRGPDGNEGFVAAEFTTPAP